MQPSTPPPPKREVLAALTIASMLIFVISFLIICNGMKHTPIRQINARVCSNIYLKCLIHSFQFFHCFFNSFICVFSQFQCQRKLVYSISCGQFSWIVSPHLYRHLHLRILQSIGHNIFPLRDSFCRITSDIRCVQHGILSQCRISAFQQICSNIFFRNINRSFYWVQ